MKKLQNFRAMNYKTSYFYIEFALTWLKKLKDTYQNNVKILGQKMTKRATFIWKLNWRSSKKSKYYYFWYKIKVLFLHK